MVFKLPGILANFNCEILQNADRPNSVNVSGSEMLPSAVWAKAASPMVSKPVGKEMDFNSSQL